MTTLNKDKKQASLKRGENFVIALKENGSTGYRWKFNIVAGSAKQLDRSYTADHDATIGCSGMLRTTFKVQSLDNVEVKAELTRFNGHVAKKHVFKIKQR